MTPLDQYAREIAKAIVPAASVPELMRYDVALRPILQRLRDEVLEEAAVAAAEAAAPGLMCRPCHDSSAVEVRKLKVSQ